MGDVALDNAYAFVNIFAAGPGASQLGLLEARENATLAGIISASVSSSFLPIEGSWGRAASVSGFSVSAVPEPETYAMMVAGIGMLSWMLRRRKT